MIRQERRIYWFSKLISNFNSSSNVFKIVKKTEALGVSFVYYLRHGVTFERGLKIGQQVLLVKKSSYKLW